MKEMYEMISSKLESRRLELKKAQESFINVCQSEMNTTNFEHNAINSLLVMQQLKTEISELAKFQTMCEINMR
jgi:hypothetical protein